MSEDKSPIERAVELAVYAPVGFVTFIRTMLPGWIEQGRQEVNRQLTTARLMGEYAAGQAQKDAGNALAQTRQTIERLASRSDGSAPTPARPHTPSTAEPSAASTPSTAASPAAAPKPTGEHLAIPGYDSLSASQVVERLAGLSSEELEAVRSYEAATRGRRTILNKIGQLQAGAPSA